MSNEINQPGVVPASHSRTLFKPASWLAKIDFINHLILFNNVLITVLSEKEGGKTSFASLLQSNLDDQIKAITLTATPPCNREQIINDIATQLHLNNDAQSDIFALVAQVNERKAHVLLIIDDAQHLPESFIKEVMLAIRNQGDFGFFHFSFVSDYSIVAALNNLAIEQFNNLIHSIEIGPLNESETRTYALQRAMSFHLITKPLSEEQSKQFYKQTKGNLATINNTLESFIFGCATRKVSKKSVLIKKASFAVSAAIVAGVSYVYFDMMQHNTPENTKNMLQHIQTAAIDAGHSAPMVLTSIIPNWQDSTTRQLVHFELPLKQNLDEQNDETDLTRLAIVDKVIVIPTIKLSPPPVSSESVVGASVAQANRTMNDATHLAAQVATVKKAVITNKQIQSSKLFTIQLAASHNKTEIKHLKQANKSLSKTRVREFKNHQGSWYILTLGEFNSRNQAQSQLNKLPPALAKLHPWVRPVASLKSTA